MDSPGGGVTGARVRVVRTVSLARPHLVVTMAVIRCIRRGLHCAGRVSELTLAANTPDP